MVSYGLYPDRGVLALPLFVALLCILTIGLGLWVAALSVKYRDFRHVTPFLVQLSLYASPVGYSSSLIPDQWRLFFYLNPMAGIIDGFRWSLLGGTAGIHMAGIVLSAALSLLLLLTGVVFFRRTERGLADAL
jgi:lipopolysaccharide transport system permease protein